MSWQRFADGSHVLATLMVVLSSCENGPATEQNSSSGNADTEMSSTDETTTTPPEETECRVRFVDVQLSAMFDSSGAGNHDCVPGDSTSTSDAATETDVVTSETATGTLPLLIACEPRVWEAVEDNCNVCRFIEIKAWLADDAVCTWMEENLSASTDTQEDPIACTDGQFHGIATNRSETSAMCAALSDQLDLSTLDIESSTLAWRAEENAVQLLCRWWQQWCEGRGHVALLPYSTAYDPPENSCESVTFLRKMQHDEAASAIAFDELGAELAAFGAPESLLREIGRAAQDEIRHAHLIASLLRSRGLNPLLPQRTSTLVRRELVEIARENLVEACVGELFAASRLLHQAQNAATPQLRRLFASIARDEARHAALGFAIHGWCEVRLSPAERASVITSMQQKILALHNASGPRVTTGDRLLFGLPSDAQRKSILQGLEARVWRTQRMSADPTAPALV
jgi:rubrerythrin